MILAITQVALRLFLLTPGVVYDPLCDTEDETECVSVDDSEDAPSWLDECVHERTGPTGGISVEEAREVCQIEACEQAIVDACVERATGQEESNCEDEDLRADFAVCFSADTCDGQL